LVAGLLRYVGPEAGDGAETESAEPFAVPRRRK
jgi:hypothetical protein